MGVLVFVLGISQLAGSKWAIPEFYLFLFYLLFI